MSEKPCLISNSFRCYEDEDRSAIIRFQERQGQISLWAGQHFRALKGEEKYGRPGDPSASSSSSFGSSLAFFLPFGKFVRAIGVATGTDKSLVGFERSRAV